MQHSVQQCTHIVNEKCRNTSVNNYYGTDIVVYIHVNVLNYYIMTHFICKVEYYSRSKKHGLKSSEKSKVLYQNKMIKIYIF